MCGIAGYFVSRGVDWRPNRAFLADLVTGIASRGWDASGYTTLNDEGNFYLLKGPVSPHRFSTDLLKKENLPIGRVGLLHTRAASVGDPDDNKNNHPLGYEVKDKNGKKSAVLITHNGSIGNLERGYNKLGISPPADVDSALIAAALGILGPLDGLKFLEQEAVGNGTIAAVWDDGTFLLARDLKPLYIGMPQPGVLIWSSEKNPLIRYCKEQAFPGISLDRIYEVPDGWYAVWDSDGKYLNPVVNGYVHTYWRLKAMTAGVAPTYIKGKGQHTTGSNGIITTQTTTAGMTGLRTAAQIAAEAAEKGGQFRTNIKPDERLPSVYAHDYEGLAGEYAKDEYGYSHIERTTTAGTATRGTGENGKTPKTAPFGSDDVPDAEFTAPGGDAGAITEPGKKTSPVAGFTEKELVTKYLGRISRDNPSVAENLRKTSKGWKGVCGWMQCWKTAIAEVKASYPVYTFPHLVAKDEHERADFWIGLCTRHLHKHIKEQKSLVIPGDKEIAKKTEAYRLVMPA